MRGRAPQKPLRGGRVPLRRARVARRPRGVACVARRAPRASPRVRSVSGGVRAAMPFLDRSVKREVAESGFELMLIEVVEYFLRGHGARAFVPDGPSAAEAGTTQEVRARLEALGVDVGTRLIERYAMERERLGADLDVVKFICKDFWEQTFKKQVDVLRTNHRGLYVLTDNDFRWLSRVSPNGDEPTDATPEDYLVFPCGLVCGALSRLGLKCRVTAEIVPLPAGHKCSFHVQVIQ